MLQNGEFHYLGTFRKALCLQIDCTIFTTSVKSSLDGQMKNLIFLFFALPLQAEKG